MVTEGDSSHRCVLADGGIEYRQTIGGSVKYAEYGRLTPTKVRYALISSRTDVHGRESKDMRRKHAKVPESERQNNL